MKSKNKSYKGTRSTRKAVSKNGRRSARRIPVVPLALVAILVAAAWFFYPVARLQYQALREKEVLAAELDYVQERNAAIREEVDQLNTPEGVEMIARENLGLVKEGENVYVVVDSAAATEGAPTELSAASSAQQMPAGLWRRVLDFIFGFDG